MKRKNIFLTIFLLIVLNLAVKLLLISKGPYHGDCLTLAVQAQKIIKTGQMQYLQSTGMPLTALLGAFFISIFRFFGITDPITSVNLMSVILSSLGAGILFLALLQIFNFRASLITSVLLTFNPLILALSTYGNSHIPALFFFTLALVFLFTHIKNPRWRDLIFCALFLGLMGASRIQDFAAIFIPVLLLLLLNNPFRLEGSRAKNQKYFKILILIIIALTVIFLFYLPAIHFSSSEKSHSLSKEIIHHFRMVQAFNAAFFMKSIRFFIRSQPILFWMFFFLGLFLLRQNNKKLFYFFAFWIICAFMTFALLPFCRPRFFTMAYIPALIVQGYCLGYFPYFKKTLLSIFFLSIFLQFESVYPLLKIRHDQALMPDYFKWVKTQTEPDALVSERDQSLFIRYYSQREPWGPPAIVFHFDKKKSREFIKNLNQMLAENKNLYITDDGLYGHPLQFGFPSFMLRNYEMEYIGTHRTEDWHFGCLEQRIFWNSLYKIKMKKSDSTRKN